MFNLLPTSRRRLQLESPDNIINNIFKDSFEPMFSSTVLSSLLNPSVDNTIDVVEKEDSFLVRLEVPGATKKDISVEFVGNTLTVKLLKNTEENTNNLFSSRINSFTVTRQIENVDSEKITAEVKNGVLVINLPKVSSSPVAKIEVTGE